MKKKPLVSIHFKNLEINNCGIFVGQNFIEFNHHQTLIFGSCGTGKTTIWKALSGDPTLQAHINKEGISKKPSVEIKTDADIYLIQEYSNLIFVNSDRLVVLGQNCSNSLLEIILTKTQSKSIQSELRKNYNSLLPSKSGKFDRHKDFSPDLMSLSEKACLGFSFLFAIRKILQLNIPIVLDSSFDMLTLPQRVGIMEFLSKQPCQQIFLCNDSHLPREIRPHYILSSEKDYSQIIKMN